MIAERWVARGEVPTAKEARRRRASAPAPSTPARSVRPQGAGWLSDPGKPGNPNPQIAAAENLFAKSRIDSGPLPLRIAPLASAARDPESLLAALREAERDRVVVAYHPAPFELPRWEDVLRRAGVGGRRRPARLRGRAVLAIRADAGAEDVLTAILQARRRTRRTRPGGLSRRGAPRPVFLPTASAAPPF